MKLDPALAEKPYYSTRTAAKLLNVSLGTVQKMVERGELGAWKTNGGHRRIHKETVHRLLATRVGHDAQANGNALDLVVFHPNHQEAQRIHGQLGKWGLPLLQMPALTMGSVIEIDNFNGDNEGLDRLLWDGVGERRNEGFGRVAVNWQPLEDLQEPPKPARQRLPEAQGDGRSGERRAQRRDEMDDEPAVLHQSGVRCSSTSASWRLGYPKPR